jgi:hypothetical protein
MTRQQFIEEQGPDIADLLTMGYDAVPCNCGENVCPQWQLLRRSQLPTADIWLDDLGPDDQPYSRAVPEGWLHVRTVEEAKAAFALYNVQNISLDHDLGACKECMQGLTAEQWLEAHAYTAMPNCEHVGTGYDLCLWMAENNIWPKVFPFVHSHNQVGTVRMLGLLLRYFPAEQP